MSRSFSRQCIRICAVTGQRHSFPFFNFERAISRLGEMLPAQTSECFYCDTTLGRFQADHFPIPARHEGRAVVRACLHCHNMKDRLSWAIFDDYLETQTPINDAEVSTYELAWLRGRSSDDFYSMWSLVDDIRDFSVPVRILIARRAAQTIDEALCS